MTKKKQKRITSGPLSAGLGGRGAAYPFETRLRVVKTITEGGASLIAAAAAVRMSPTTIKNWIYYGVGGGEAPPDRNHVRRVRGSGPRPHPHARVPCEDASTGSLRGNDAPRGRLPRVDVSAALLARERLRGRTGVYRALLCLRDGVHVIAWMSGFALRYGPDALRRMRRRLGLHVERALSRRCLRGHGLVCIGP